MTSKKFRTLISMVCFGMAILFSVNASAASLSISDIAVLNQKHITEEVFDGYEGLETTLSGKVGFNYDLVTPDGNHVVLIGFNPYMTKSDSYYNSVYKIGTGWQIKLPYLDINAARLYQADGYSYSYLVGRNLYSLVNYPGTAQLSKIVIGDIVGYCFVRADGSKDYFSNDGRILKTIDAFENITEYSYLNGVLSKITYPDNSSVHLIRTQASVELKYNNNTETVTFATVNFATSPDNVLVLESIDYDKGNLSFKYSEIGKTLVLSTYTIENKHSRSIQYDATAKRIQSSMTTYADGSSISKQYYYDAQGRVSRYVDGDFAEEQYEYTLNRNGDLIIDTTKSCQGTTSVDTKTFNSCGQFTKYVQNGTTLELEYNEYNAVSEEKEGNLTINYSFTPQGKVSLADFSNGEQIAYNYYSDGQLEKVETNNQQTYYSRSGNIEKITNTNKVLFDVNQPATFSSPTTRSIGSNISVLYNINSYVGVTNFHTYYGLSQSGFNCYSYAIGKHDRSYNPGNLSGRTLNLSSFSGIKANVEADQRSLSRGIYDCAVNADIPGHCWEIALRIRSGQDYHFMQKSRDRSWGFKAGVGGPVMEVLSNRTPNDITWDTYNKPLFSSQYKVQTSAFYNSQISYMMIRD